MKIFNRLRRRKRVADEVAKRIIAPQLWPMGPLTFAIACSHCENLHSDKCDRCKREIESGFKLKHTKPEVNHE